MKISWTNKTKVFAELWFCIQGVERKNGVFSEIKSMYENLFFANGRYITYEYFFIFSFKYTVTKLL